MSLYVDYRTEAWSVIDLETTIRNTGEDAVGKSTGSPHHPDNKIFLYGVTKGTIPNSFSPHPKKWPRDTFRIQKDPEDLFIILQHVNLLVGHNIKFDILYLLYNHYDEFMDWLRKGGKIWDTMHAEYLLTQQEEQFAPLGNKYKKVFTPVAGGTTLEEKVLVREGLGPKYGGTDKDDKIAEYWNAGIDTPDIPFDLLYEYLQDDLRNTSIVYVEQLELALAKGASFMKLLTSQMDAIVATSMIEYNGIRMDVYAASEKAEEIAVRHDAQEEWLQSIMADELNLHIHPSLPAVEFIKPKECNPASAQQLSTVLFGGQFKFVRDIQQVDENGNAIRYKTGPRKGQPKTKKTELLVDIPETLAPFTAYSSDIDSNNNGKKLDESTLKKLKVKVKSKWELFIDSLLEYRSLEKELSVSYMGLMKLVWPTDSCVHGNLNHTATNTGRLSSSAPNMQNFSGKETD